MRKLLCAITCGLMLANMIGCQCSTCHVPQMPIGDSVSMGGTQVTWGSSDPYAAGGDYSNGACATGNQGCYAMAGSGCGCDLRLGMEPNCGAAACAWNGHCDGSDGGQMHRHRCCGGAGGKCGAEAGREIGSAGCGCSNGMCSAEADCGIESTGCGGGCSDQMCSNPVAETRSRPRGLACRGAYGNSTTGCDCAACSGGPVGATGQMRQAAAMRIATNPHVAHFRDKAERRCEGGYCHGGPGPMQGAVTYPYYTTRGPRDFFHPNPPSIGP